MARYLVRNAFIVNSPHGHQTRSKGEAMSLSSSNAAPLVSRGLLVEEHVGQDLLDRFEERVKVLLGKLDYSREDAHIEAAAMVTSILKRHESLKLSAPPRAEFITEVAEFNRTLTGKNPVLKAQSAKGVGEWAGYTCNIGQGCSHGCLYCYGEKMAVRFKRVENAASWREETLRDVSTEGCRKYDSPIMFPTTHDITATYLAAYRCHLFNLLNAGNKVLIVTKPRRESIQAICSDFSAFRDSMTFRFTIGGLDEEVMGHWEPGAPPLPERLECLRYAFEQGYATSVSAEPMLGGRDEAERLYHLLAPYITEDIWFGTMNNIGGLRTSSDREIATQTTRLLELQSEGEVMNLVETLGGSPKVRWKDSIQEVVARHGKALTS